MAPATRSISKVTKTTSNSAPKPTNSATEEALLNAATSADASLRPPPRTGPAETIQQANMRLLDSGEFSDMLLKCEGQSWKVHKSIICPQSDFFSGCARGGFKESIEGVITLMEDKAEDVKRMLSFLYCGNYFEHPDDMRKYGRATNEEIFERAYKPKAEEDTEEELQSHGLLTAARMYEMGNKYGIPSLKNCSLNKIKQFQKATKSDSSILHAINQWERLIAAAELSVSLTVSTDDPLVLLCTEPLAQFAPAVACMTHIPGKFANLIESITRSPDLGLLVFTKSCHYSQDRLKTEAKTADIWKKRYQRLNKSICAGLPIIDTIIDGDLEEMNICCNPDNETCTANMYPCLRGSKGTTTGEDNYLAFKCEDCGYECIATKMPTE